MARRKRPRASVSCARTEFMQSFIGELPSSVVRRVGRAPHRALPVEHPLPQRIEQLLGACAAAKERDSAAKARLRRMRQWLNGFLLLGVQQRGAPSSAAPDAADDDFQATIISSFEGGKSSFATKQEEERCLALQRAADLKLLLYHDKTVRLTEPLIDAASPDLVRVVVHTAAVDEKLDKAAVNAKTYAALPRLTANQSATH